MTKAVDYTQWHSSGTDEPRDQNRDLSGPYMAQVGPDDRHQPGGWSWTVIDVGSGDEVAGDEHAADEAAAKAAVQEWAETNLWVWLDDIGGGYVNVVTNGGDPLVYEITREQAERDYPHREGGPRFRGDTN